MTTRTCRVCEQTKNIELFPLRERGMRRRVCKKCWSKGPRSKYYLENKAKINTRNKEWRTKTRRENFKQLWSYLASHPCVDCGETDYVVLEFDHRDDCIKMGNISSMMAHASWNSIYEEIVKCDVRCANCHKRRTAKQLGWYAEYSDFLPDPSSK